MSFKIPSQKTLKSKLARFVEINHQLNQLSAEKDELKEFFQELMQQKGLEEMLVDVYKINYKKFEVEQFNKCAFKEQHEDLYNQYIEYRIQDRLTIR